MPGEKKSPKAGAPAITGSLLAKLLIPYTTVFVSSFCIMVLELVAGRLIARHLGSSLYTWTSVIGVVLAGIAIGNYIGGLIADRYEARRALTLQFILASAASAAIVVLDGLVGDWPALWKLSWPNRVASHVTLVFFVPSCLLGTISPVIAKMALDVGRETGRTIGSVYAWGVVGSLFGTFMTGFYFIDWFGTITIIWSVAAVLAAGALYYGFQSWKSWGWAAALLAVCTVANSAWAGPVATKIGLQRASDPRVLYTDESQYSYIEVFQESKNPDVRSFNLDTLTHSRIEMGNLNNFRYAYEKIYAAITTRLSRGKENLRTLTIGGGGYVYPRWVHETWPGSETEVAEIDPAVTEAAMAAFGLPRDTTIKCLHVDGRVYVDQLVEAKKRGEDINLYGFIYCDAVVDYAVPYQLTTREFMEMVKALLTDDGAYLMNMIDIYDSGLLLGSLYVTMREVFPHVTVLTEGMPYTRTQKGRNTYILYAGFHPLDTNNLGAEYAPTCEIFEIPGDALEKLASRQQVQILSDDHAPVENLVAPVVLGSTEDRAYDEWVARAVRHAEQGQFGDAINAIRRARDLKPGRIEAVGQHGVILNQQGRYKEAAEVFEEAIKFDPTKPELHHDLANSYVEMGKLREALEHYRKAVELNPEYASAWFQAGVILQQNNQLDQALTCYMNTLNAEPEHLNARKNMATTLINMQRLDEAVRLLSDSIPLAPQDAQLHFLLGNVHQFSERLDEAIQEYRKAMELDASMAEAPQNLAICLAQRGQPAEAIRVLEELVRRHPDNLNARYNLGYMLAEAGRYQEAMRELEIVAQSNPNDAGLRQLIEETRRRMQQGDATPGEGQ